MKKIAIVVDQLGSGLAVAAEGHKSLHNNFEVIYSSEYLTPSRLLIYLERGKFEKIIFSWRFLLLDLISCKEYLKEFQLIRQTSSIGILIPDLMGLLPKFKEQEDILIDFVDFFLVTSQFLFDEYSKRHGRNKLLGQFHDISNPKLIEEIYKAKNSKTVTDPMKLIWIGNSKWGHRQGFSDHKGMQTVLIPLIRRLQEENVLFEISIIDSSKRKISHIDTLKLLAEADYLIQTSAGEGTCLPIIEACGLGVVPITTNVGVVNELLLKSLPNLIVPRDVNAFIEALLHTQNRIHPRVLRDIFDDYLRISRKEAEALIIMPIEKSNKLGLHKNSSSLKQKFLFHLKWITRYFSVNKSF